MPANSAEIASMRDNQQAAPRVTTSNRVRTNTLASWPERFRHQQFVLAMAFLASLAFDWSRSDESPSPVVVGAIALISALTILVAGRWLAVRNRDAVRPPTQVNLFVIAAMFSNVPIELVTRYGLGLGQAGELRLLESLRNLLLALAAVGLWRSYERLAVVLSLFLIVFVTSVSEHPRTIALLAGYSFVGVGWLMATYWDQVRCGLVASEQRRVPRAVAVSLCILFLVLCGALAWFRSPSSTIVALTGFLPTSGGNGQFDPFARSGVNDGDAMVAAKKDADSVGPVNSDIFLTSDLPSLYDALSDLYGEPVKPKDQSRAVALGAELARPEKQHATSMKDGRQFSTLRSKSRNSKKIPDDLNTLAMFFVAGRTPLHLRLETFDHFDGHSWTHALPDRTERMPVAEQFGNQTWFRFALPLTSIELGETRFHQLKIANLATNRIPLPPGANAVRVDRVEFPDFFGDTTDDAIRLRGSETLPALTILQLRSERASEEALRRGDFQNIAKTGRNFLDVDPMVRSQLESLAESWTEGVPAGWPTINAIVDRLRSRYRFDAHASLPNEVENSAVHFLTESQSGPDYLFATSAVLLLRTLGYPCRFCVGFYADPKHYDSQSRSTPIFKRDVHVWAEVCLAGRHWIPIEPTPGYETLPLEQSLWQRAWGNLLGIGRWTMRHRISVCGSLLLLLLAWWKRAWCWEQWFYFRWWCSRWSSPRRHVLATVQLWERRAKLAGVQRPRWQSAFRWCEELLPRVVSEHNDRQSFDVVLQAAQRLCYSPNSDTDSQMVGETPRWRSLCAATVRVWTVSRIRIAQQPLQKSRTAEDSPNISLWRSTASSERPQPIAEALNAGT